MNSKIPKQTEAEHDQHLIDSFVKSNFIEGITEEGLTIISGRKGAGKTAICRYITEKAEESGLDYASRFSVRAASAEQKDDVTPPSVVLFILLRTIQEFLDNGIFERKYKKQWSAFLVKNNMGGIKDFGQFVEISRSTQSKVKINAKAFEGLDVGLEDTKDSGYAQVPYTTAITALAINIKKTVKKQKVIIFIDDLSDHLDVYKKESIKDGIKQIGKILQIFDDINTESSNNSKKYLKFVCCVRNDLWEYMEGSNINKLENNSLDIIWSEKIFCELLIRRLDYYKDDQDKYLEDPINSIKKLFPDEIFEEKIKTSSTKSYRSNFYAYIMAISFNRPRDFLKFCYALRDRLPANQIVTFENIESAEIEYTDYFIKEVKDELYIINEIFSIDQSLEALMKLLTPLAEKDNFKYGQMRSRLNSMISKGSHNDLRVFVKDLWWYGILGLKRDKEDLLHFRYMPNEASYYPVEDDVKDYSFALHRGILWHLRKKYRHLKEK